MTAEYITRTVWELLSRNAGEVLAAFGGALFGALFAFLFESSREISGA